MTMGTIAGPERTNPVVSKVFLPKEWKGGDEGLAHLHDVYCVGILCMVQAPVTDEGLRHLAALSNLEYLDLVQTKATDKGLVHLQALVHLKGLHLEGTAGGSEFSDAALKVVAELPELESLKLYGPGFTDEALQYLQRMPNLVHLWLTDTAIDKQRLEDLRRSRPGLDWRKY
jgi:hypothetical protein